MNKFRARQLDACKPIAIYVQGQTPPIAEIISNATNRTVPQLPTGMEKEEETEHHLQQAIFHQRVIPVPEVYDTTQSKNLFKLYDGMYPPNFKMTVEMVHIHPFDVEIGYPDYDIDSGDETWMEEQRTKCGLMNFSPIQFEQIMDRLEKASGLRAVTLPEAKLLLDNEDELITAVFDHWLNKRLSLQHPLIPQVVKSEKGTGAAPSDPYVAFRKRTEKMQTRKNRKNDEISYERMLKLRRDLSRATKLVDLVSLREDDKQSLLRINMGIYEIRYKIDDYSGVIILDILASRPQPVMVGTLHNHQLSGLEPDMDRHVWRKLSSTPSSTTAAAKKRKNESKERRPYRKKRKISVAPISTPNIQYNNTSDSFSAIYSQEGHSSVGVSEDDLLSHSEGEDEAGADGVYTFRRKANVVYLAPKDPPSRSPDSRRSSSFGSSGDFAVNSSRGYCLTTLSTPVITCLARRRVGRGGRVLLDRITTSTLKETERDELFSDTINWPRFHPTSPSSLPDSDDAEADASTVGGGGLPKSLDGPAAFFISAEVTEGRWAGSCSQLEVVIPAGLAGGGGGTSGSVGPESNGLLLAAAEQQYGGGGHQSSSSRFSVWGAGGTTAARVILKTNCGSNGDSGHSSGSGSSSYSGGVAGGHSLLDDSSSTGAASSASSSCVNNSFSSSLGAAAAQAFVKMSAVAASADTCTFSSPSSPAAAAGQQQQQCQNNSGGGGSLSATGRVTALKSNSSLLTAASPDNSSVKKKSVSYSGAAASSPLFLQRAPRDGCPLLDPPAPPPPPSVQMCNNSVVLSNNGSSKSNNGEPPILHAGLVSKVLTSWNNSTSDCPRVDDSVSATVTTPLTNGPKSRRTKVTPVIFSETENL